MAVGRGPRDVTDRRETLRPQGGGLDPVPSSDPDAGLGPYLVGEEVSRKVNRPVESDFASTMHTPSQMGSAWRIVANPPRRASIEVKQ